MLGLPYNNNMKLVYREEMPKITSGLEDYIEAIRNLQYGKDSIRAVDIAQTLNVSRASVSEALKRLSEIKLIDYDRYGKIVMTDAGIKAADVVIHRHSVLYEFLRYILGMSENEADNNACKIEHVVSEEVICRLSKFINTYDTPKTDS